MLQAKKVFLEHQTGIKLGKLPDTFPSLDSPNFHKGLSTGKFLVAGKYLRDPRFAETVILLINYDRSGAMGLIINRPTEVKLSAVFPDIKGLRQKVDTVYIGGPVARRQMLLLMGLGSQPKNSFPVFDNIYVSLSSAVFKSVIGNLKEGERFRIYYGYAGWSPGQLEQEVFRGDWCILQADVETIFDKTVSTVWPELINRCSALQVRMHFPGLQDGFFNRNDIMAGRNLVFTNKHRFYWFEFSGRGH